MKISTRGRYSMRLIADIISNQPEDGFVSLREVSERQGISIKYLEQLVTPLLKAKLLSSERGKEGGYRCNIDASDIRLSDILAVTDNMKPVACLQENAEPCDKFDRCPTVGMWIAFSKQIDSFFEGITIQDLLDGKFPKE